MSVQLCTKSVKRRRLSLVLAASAICLSILPLPALAQSLPIPNMPVMRDIPGAHELPDPKLDYKIVFDIETLADSPEKVSPALIYIAAVFNTFAKNGIPADHIHFAAIFHGKSIVLITDDTTYKGRTGTEKNPNADLLRQLDKAGLKMAVCGQSAMEQHYDFKTILPVAQIDYSASVAFMNLQTRGYVLAKD